MKIQRSIRLSPEADEILRVMAHREERSVSQLVEMAVRNQFMAPAGFRARDGRTSERTKAAQEQGAYMPGNDPEAPAKPKPRERRDGSLAESPAMARQRKLNDAKYGRRS